MRMKNTGPNLKNSSPPIGNNKFVFVEIEKSARAVFVYSGQ